MPPPQQSPDYVINSIGADHPELSSMYASSFSAPLAQAQAEVGAQKAQDTISAAKAAASSSNYRQLPKSDGGFTFLDPSGKEISAADFAAATGKNPGDVLKNSTNPIDIAYQKDFTDLQDYLNNRLQAKTNPQAAAKAKDVESQIYNDKALTQINGGTPIRLGQLAPVDVINTFKAAYPTIYGTTNTGIPDSRVFIPQSRI